MDNTKKSFGKFQPKRRMLNIQSSSGISTQNTISNYLRKPSVLPGEHNLTKEKITNNSTRDTNDYLPTKSKSNFHEEKKISINKKGDVHKQLDYLFSSDTDEEVPTNNEKDGDIQKQLDYLFASDSDDDFATKKSAKGTPIKKHVSSSQETMKENKKNTSISEKPSERFSYKPNGISSSFNNHSINFGYNDSSLTTMLTDIVDRKNIGSTSSMRKSHSSKVNDGNDNEVVKINDGFGSSTIKSNVKKSSPSKMTIDERVSEPKRLQKSSISEVNGGFDFEFDFTSIKTNIKKSSSPKKDEPIRLHNSINEVNGGFDITSMKSNIKKSSPTKKDETVRLDNSTNKVSGGYDFGFDFTSIKTNIKKSSPSKIDEVVSEPKRMRKSHSSTTVNDDKDHEVFDVSGGLDSISIKSNVVKSSPDKNDEALSEPVRLHKSINDVSMLLNYVEASPALKSLDPNAPCYEVENNIKLLKEREREILDNVFNWFTQTPLNLAKQIPCIGSFGNLLKLKILRQRIKAKIKQSEGVLNRKKTIENNNNSLKTNGYQDISTNEISPPINGYTTNVDEISPTVNGYKTNAFELAPKKRENFSRLNVVETTSHINGYENSPTWTGSSVKSPALKSSYKRRYIEDSDSEEEIKIDFQTQKVESAVSKWKESKFNNNNSRNDSDMDMDFFEEDDCDLSNYSNKKDNNSVYDDVPPEFDLQMNKSENWNENGPTTSKNSKFLFKKPVFGSLSSRSDSTGSPELQNSKRDYGNYDKVENYEVNEKKSNFPELGKDFSTNFGCMRSKETPSRPQDEKNTERMTRLGFNPKGVLSMSDFEDSDEEMIDLSETVAMEPDKDEDNQLGRFSSDTPNDGTTGEFSGTNYAHSQDLAKLFRQKFGLHKFRPNQLEAINAALLGHDCFILMPTGGGKSLCYQLPALLTNGITFVISPLKSLIHDQTMKLKSLDIPAGHLLSETTVAETNAIYMDLAKQKPSLKMLYVTPEKLAASVQLQNAMTNLYARKLLSRFVIDEAHCVSQWGHDFRPDYKRLCTLRQNYPQVPIMALTATATPRVRTDILHQLNIKNPKWFLSSFNRPNLKYQVLPKKGKSAMGEIIEMIKSNFARQSGIVYCLSRKECDVTAKDLSSQSIKAVSYHAGLSDKQRNEVQAKWSGNKVQVVCATIAFGMGIDKPDVRFVIHYSLPKSIEGYYQESGRAGRDGRNSCCVLFYNYQDVFRIRKLIEIGDGTAESKQVHLHNLYRIVTFCENRTDCRRTLQLSYFGERFNRELCVKDPSTTCDNCKQQETYKLHDVTEECKTIVKTVSDICGTMHTSTWNNNFTFNHIIDIFKGSTAKKIVTSGHDKHELHGKGKHWDRVEVERLIHKLTLEGYLQEKLVANREEMILGYIKLGPKANELLSGNCKIMFPMMESSGKKITGVNDGATDANKAKKNNPQVEAIHDQCYEQLMDLCRAMASSLNVTLNSIMTIQAVQSMSRNLPVSKEEMLKIDGVTKANFEKYGKHLLEITQQFASQKMVLQCEDDDDDEDMYNWNNEENNACSPYFGGSPSVRRTKTAGTRRKFKKGFRGRKKRTKKSTPKKAGKTTNNKAIAAQAKSLYPSRTTSARKPGFLSAPKTG